MIYYEIDYVILLGLTTYHLKLCSQQKAVHIYLEHLHNLLLQCLKEGAVPEDMRDAKIITLYNSKGKMSYCNNYRGILLLSFVGKAFAPNRLQVLADSVYQETPCGLRSARSTIGIVFLVKQAFYPPLKQDVHLSFQT